MEIFYSATEPHEQINDSKSKNILRVLNINELLIINVDGSNLDLGLGFLKILANVNKLSESKLNLLSTINI